MLDRVDALRIFHVHEVDDVEFEVFAVLFVLRVVLTVVIVELLRQRGELVVIDYHGETLRCLLPYERLHDGERFTRTRRTDDEGATERVVDVDPSMTELSLVVVPHRDVYGVFRFLKLLVLLKTFVLEVEAVFHDAVLDVFRDVIQCDVDGECADDGGHHVEPGVYHQREDVGVEVFRREEPE